MFDFDQMNDILTRAVGASADPFLLAPPVLLGATRQRLADAAVWGAVFGITFLVLVGTILGHWRHPRADELFVYRLIAVVIFSCLGYGLKRLFRPGTARASDDY